MQKNALNNQVVFYINDRFYYTRKAHTLEIKNFHRPVKILTLFENPLVWGKQIRRWRSSDKGRNPLLGDTSMRTIGQHLPASYAPKLFGLSAIKRTQQKRTNKRICENLAKAQNHERSAHLESFMTIRINALCVSLRLCQLTEIHSKSTSG